MRTMTNTSEQRNSILIFLVGLLQTVLYAYGHFIDGDVVQILAKAHLLVTQNILTPYGNVSSSGASGNIPGAFLTLITGLPMKLIFSPWSALFALTLLHLAAFWLFYKTLLGSGVQSALLLSTIFFWLNPWRMSEVFLWNPSYLFFATALHMWTAFHLSRRPYFWMSFWHGQSLFIALQIHPSFLILFFLTMILLYTGALKPHWGGTLIGIFFGLLTLTPYFIAGLKDPSVFPQPGSGDGKGFLFFGLIAVYPLLKTIWYWILFGSGIFQTHIFHQLRWDWLGSSILESIIPSLWLVVKYSVGALTVWFGFKVNFALFKDHWSVLRRQKFRKILPEQWLKTYTMGALGSALIATAISPTLPIYWHLIIVWPMALIPIILYLGQGTLNIGKLTLTVKKYLTLLVVYFFMTNTLAAIQSKKHDVKKPFHQLYFEVCKELCVLPEKNQ